jgi:two-component system, OmpR family, response regulator
VEVAHTGRAALELASHFRPSVAMMDIGLPDIDGFELAARFRQLDETRGTRLVAITGYGHADDRRRTAAAGFEHHLVKPVEPERLNAVLDALAPAVMV